MNFKKVSPIELELNPFDRIGNDWMLITAGDESRYNTMTASWGQMGIMWGKPVVNVFIRPQRHTRGFVDDGERFTINLFVPKSMRSELTLLGTKSGRDGDKIAEAGMSIQCFDGVAAVAQSQVVMVCRKLYQHDIGEEGFVVAEVGAKHYPQKDFHRMYIGEIEAVYVADDE